MNKIVSSFWWLVSSLRHTAQRFFQSTHYPLSTNNFSVKAQSAFTLIEMMVAVSLFAMVMLIGVGALLSLVETNRRAQAINSVINNMNAALEGMSRSIRVGTTYHCRTSASFVQPEDLSVPQDCAIGGGKLLAFESSEGSRSDVDDQVVFRLNGTQLERSLEAGANGTWVALTAPEVTIDPDVFEFYVIGSTPQSSGGDDVQPRVLIKIKGSAPVPGGTTQFNVQAGVTQRLIDI